MTQSPSPAEHLSVDELAAALQALTDKSVGDHRVIGAETVHRLKLANETPAVGNPDLAVALYLYQDCVLPMYLRLRLEGERYRYNESVDHPRTVVRAFLVDYYYGRIGTGAHLDLIPPVRDLVCLDSITPLPPEVWYVVGELLTLARRPLHEQEGDVIDLSQTRSNKQLSLIQGHVPDILSSYVKMIVSLRRYGLKGF